MSTQWQVLVVQAKWREATDIAALRLADPAGHDLPSFTPGAHVDVEIAPTLIRQFSLCGSPEERGAYEIGVLRDPASRGGSIALVDRVQVGDRLRVSFPKSNFSLVPAAEHSILIAGGIGITPILCMAERLAAEDRSFEMHYAARALERAAYRKRIAESGYRANVRFYFSEGAEPRRLDLSAVLAAARPAAHVYVCGPGRLIDAVLEQTARAGWPSTQVHREFFAAQEPPSHGLDGGFDVKIASSGEVLHVAAGRSIGAVLREHGIAVEMTCEEGICGNCITRVLAGEPDHRDLYLTPEQQSANDQMAVCCSRSKGALLVLDL